MRQRLFAGGVVLVVFLGTVGCNSGVGARRSAEEPAGGAPDALAGAAGGGVANQDGVERGGEPSIQWSDDDLGSWDTPAEDVTFEYDPEQCTLERSCTPGSPDPADSVPVSPTPPATAADEFQALTEKIAALASLDAAGFAERYVAALAAGVLYEPTESAGIDLIQDTGLRLVDSELEILRQNGFVISDRTSFPNFVYGYETIYALDLPLFVSADSILFAIHQSYDTLLRELEQGILIGALERFLDGSREGLAAAREAGFSEESVADADLYLAVPRSLLAGERVEPVAGADSSDIGCLLGAIDTKDGCVKTKLFGLDRVFDFSQFTRRGHYTDDPRLGRYFEAMMWLGRIDFRILETEPDGTQRLNRRQLEAALVLRWLYENETVRDSWQTIDRAVTAFVGEHDSMTLPQLDGLLSDLGVSGVQELAEIDNDALAQAIVSGGYGAQRISSHIMVNGAGGTTLPLSAIFEVFGQRYIADSHVLSNVVYDRAKKNGDYVRMLPNPLDVAFAAFGNNQAGELLAGELQTYAYAPNLASMRETLDAHSEDYWQSTLYNHLVDALRSLSSSEEAADPAAVGLPAVAGTAAWGRRLLNTQLASWAELRHDTLLYAKQSYTTGTAVCEYPDAYVEPYPEFWAKLVRFAEFGQKLAVELAPSDSSTAQRVADYFDTLARAVTILQQMAENQRVGQPHTQEQLAFINEAVRLSRPGGGCGRGGASATDASGWYAKLFVDAADRVSFDPTIADVHTQPTDEVGNIVGMVLHVATGSPRQMVVTVDTCTGPRAYVGLVSSYFERVTSDFDRLTDERWVDEIYAGIPEDVAWMQDLVDR